MSGMFATDGCVLPNIVTREFIVFLGPKCKHTKIKAGAIVLSAECAADAARFVANWLRIPQTVIVKVIPAPDYAMANVNAIAEKAE